MLLSLLPAVADAKGIANAQVCGTDRCVDLGRQDGFGIVEAGTPVDVRHAEAFAEAKVVFTHGRARDVLTFQFLPGAGVMRDGEGHFGRPDAATVELLRKMSESLALFPAERLVAMSPELSLPRALAPPGDEGLPWGPIGLAALAAMIAAGAVVMTVRRRRAATST